MKAKFSFSAYLLLLGLLAGIVFAFRLQALRQTEPRSDQARFARWVKDLVAADHFFPRRQVNSSWREAFESDRGSWLHNYATRIYVAPHQAFTSLPLFLTYALSLVVGGSYPTHVVIGIFFSSLVVVVVGLWAWPGKEETQGHQSIGNPRLLGILAAIAAGFSPYLHFYSAWGVHNFGILGLVAAVAVCLRCPPRKSSGSILPVIVAVIAAIYCHWTNVFVLAPAVFGWLLLRGRAGMTSWRQVLLFAGSIGVVCLPVAMLTILSHRQNGGHSDLAYAALSGGGVGEYCVGVCERFAKWWVTGFQLFSWPGLLLGVAGLGLAAFRHRQTLPLIVLGGHLVCWSAIPGFIWNGSPTWTRTYPYTLPLLAFGLATAVAWAVGQLQERQRLKVRWAGGSFLILGCLLLGLLHLRIVGVAFLRSPVAVTNIEAVNEWFLDGQGTLTGMVDEIDAIIPSKGVLLPWTYPIQDVYVAVSNRPSSEVSVMPALETIYANAQQGEVVRYFERRGLAFKLGADTFILVDSAIQPDQVTLALNTVAKAINPESGTYSVAPAGQWNTHNNTYKNLRLFKISSALGR